MTKKVESISEKRAKVEQLSLAEQAVMALQGHPGVEMPDVQPVHRNEQWATEALREQQGLFAYAKAALDIERETGQPALEVLSGIRDRAVERGPEAHAVVELVDKATELIRGGLVDDGASHDFVSKHATRDDAGRGFL